MNTRFHNRREAGRALATLLLQYSGRDDVSVLALPRGGVPVAYEVAKALRAPLDVLIVRKLGAPMQPELALGAIASGGVRVLNAREIVELGISGRALRAIEQAEVAELTRRETLFRPGAGPLDVRDRVCIVVDDGIATGASMRAAVAVLAALDAGKIVVAVPVAASDECSTMASLADEVVCAMTPQSLSAIGLWYDDFSQTSDREARELLALAPGSEGNGPGSPEVTSQDAPTPDRASP